MIVEIITFAFKKNTTTEANYIIDVRFLNNPFYVDHLSSLCGLDKEVIDYFKKDKTTCEFLMRLYDWTGYLIDINKKAGAEKISIAIGCTGGQHRSPYIAESLGNYLRTNSPVDKITIYHSELDLGKDKGKDKSNVCNQKTP